MKYIQMKSSILLLLTAFIWGIAFVAQSVGMDYVGAFTFNGVRSIVGGIVLIPCIWFLNRKYLERKEEKKDKKLLLIGGISCGTALFIGSSLQQIGIGYTTVGKAGFITSLYIILVPVFGIFMKKKVKKNVWMGVLLALAGFYLLCMTDGFSINKGDILILLGAVGFSFHILIIDYFSARVDGVKMACIQFLVCGLFSIPAMFLWEQPSIEAILGAGIPILYAGILSCGVGYTLQIIGQKGLEPTIASLILSLESVFSVLAGWVLLHERMSRRELIGCVLVFGAIILAQLKQKDKKEDTKRDGSAYIKNQENV